MHRHYLMDITTSMVDFKKRAQDTPANVRLHSKLEKLLREAEEHIKVTLATKLETTIRRKCRQD